MAIEVVWDDEEKTIIRWIIQGKLEWEEYEQASQLSREMCDSVDHPVYTIFDARQMARMPDNALVRLPQMSIQTPSNQPLAVVIGARGFAQTLIRIYNRVYRGLTAASTLEEAYAIIEDDKLGQR
jgi:hypothetical protein